MTNQGFDVVLRLRIPVRVVARACREAEGRRSMPINDWIVQIIDGSLPDRSGQRRLFVGETTGDHG